MSIVFKIHKITRNISSSANGHHWTEDEQPVPRMSGQAGWVFPSGMGGGLRSGAGWIYLPCSTLTVPLPMNRHGGVFLGLLIGGHSLDFDHRTLNISATGDHSFAGPYCSYEVLVHYRCFCSEARISVINLRLRKTLKSLS